LISPTLSSLLDRPDAERLREHRYRFGQAFVFGSPVVFLACYGHALGGATAGLWSGLLQALLAGWVIYVCAVGMLFEGILMLARRRFAADLLVAAAAIALSIAGLIAWGRLLLRGPSATVGWWFAASVLVLGAWAGLQWLRLARRMRVG
jgi:cation transport ATPase